MHHLPVTAFVYMPGFLLAFVIIGGAIAWPGGKLISVRVGTDLAPLRDGD